ncbi:HalOD1 output domain-containing protein [Haloarcula marina]|uniref:HalOD1 output domain-containing protein n=1 Tax=Haloarcula marina TaxID=2961574 RepID=UPI0020B80C12|nr:HalOD1 output domain-containing protein [Halomicroarcula marina]
MSRSEMRSPPVVASIASDSSTDDIVHAIVSAVATATDQSVVDIDPPLYDCLDPDALGRVIETAENAVVEFRHAGCAVTVDSDGTVTADPVARGGTADRSDDSPPLS